MMPTVLLAVLLAVYPIKPDLSLKFNDIRISQLLGTAKLVGITLDLPFKLEGPLEGRVRAVNIQLRGHVVSVDVRGVSIISDASKVQPLQTVVGFYNRKTKYWCLKLEALGGIIEVEGVLPK